MMFKRQAIEDRMQLAVKEWEGSGADPSAPKPPDGANFKEIKEAWKYTADTRNQDFHERLPSRERSELLKGQEASARDVAAFEQAAPPGQPPNIEGVYLEQIVPF